MEEYRKKTISVVKEKRNQLIQDKESQSVRHNNSTRDRSSSSAQTFSMENRIDGIIMNERRAIEKIKQRQKNEIQAMIESEVKSEIIKNKSEMKERKLKEKEEKIKEEMRLKAIKEE